MQVRFENNAKRRRWKISINFFETTARQIVGEINPVYTWKPMYYSFATQNRMFLARGVVEITATQAYGVLTVSKVRAVCKVQAEVSQFKFSADDSLNPNASMRDKHSELLCEYLESTLPKMLTAAFKRK